MADTTTQSQKTLLGLRSKARQTQKATHAAKTPAFLRAEQKTAAFSVNVSLTLCKQAPVSTCEGAVLTELSPSKKQHAGQRNQIATRCFIQSTAATSFGGATR